MAERRTFSMTGAIFLVLKWTVLSACSTRRPLIISRTSFAFCGLVRWNFASARNSRIFSTAALAMIFVLQNFNFTTPCGGLAGIRKPQLLGLCGGLSSSCRVALERAGRGKLAELVAHH